MYPQGKEDICEIMKDKLGEDTYFPGRFFFCCVAGQEVLVLMDNRRRLDGENSAGFSNVFVPMLCGECRRRTAARKAAQTISLDEVHRGDEPRQYIEIDLHTSLIQGWVAYKAVQKYCSNDVAIFSQMVDHRIVQREVQKYYVRTNTAMMEVSEDWEEMRLKVLPYFNPSFF
jgi:hypothetical protein